MRLNLMRNAGWSWIMPFAIGASGCSGFSALTNLSGAAGLSSVSSISVPPLALFAATDPITAGQATTLVPIGGTGPYSFSIVSTDDGSWVSGQTFYAGASAGTEVVSVSDSSSPQQTAILTIAVGAASVATAGPTVAPVTPVTMADPACSVLATNQQFVTTSATYFSQEATFLSGEGADWATWTSFANTCLQNIQSDVTALNAENWPCDETQNVANYVNVCLKGVKQANCVLGIASDCAQ